MHGPTIELLHIDRTSHEARFAFRCSADIEHLFWPARELTLYSSEGVCSTPSDLAGAFFLTMAPVGWMYAADIRMPFRIAVGAKRTVDAVGRYLAEYYGWPYVDLTARLAIDEEEDIWPRSHAGLFFSGGVDSSTALAELGDRIDWLIHMSNFENLDSMITAAQAQRALDVTRRIAHARGLGWMHLRTNIAAIFKHNKFDHKFPRDSSFWLGLAHVHHLAVALSVARPRLSRVYLAGGFNELLQKVGSCAASSAFVERYSWKPPCHLLHEHTLRQEKIEYLIDTDPTLLRTLRVCFSSGDGTCFECRKCQATALMLISAGGRIVDTSFAPEILDRLEASVARLSTVGPEGEYFFNQCLNGRRLTGTREERWATLLELIQQQRTSSHSSR
jgi:hypothetical protein